MAPGAPPALGALFTKAQAGVLSPGLAWLDPDLPAGLARRCHLALAWTRFHRELDPFISNGMLAA